ncbi:Methylated-DNA--protein-cysteine methyltransferase, constitutive [Corynebacterium atrinae]|uniref:methylated-DNA--[protein]-cysteine S-methyltransferase n=1 Tax=Corynebacterium atrinae TaxID=1336740 RepID=UPI0025B389D7|nr:methylated-DNA--[protein]-cysteine S-methyltransferase [Corynebacterium atrinae]WJY62849.1 Methylated-DNA--protein-cysteine methyltransferase, constitutive [Corynebacterium atrinae]
MNLASFPISRADLDQLHVELGRRAAAEGNLDVAYRIVDSPLGPLLLAATEKGLVRVAFEVEGFDAVLTTIAAKVSPRVLEAPARLDTVAGELEEYFSGRRQVFDLPLDFALSAGFRREVHSFLPRITYGNTRSYKEVAALVGKPTAIRAVGTACATNPLPVIIPCHRVLRSDGTLGGYLGGLEAKSILLDLEKGDSHGAALR